MACDPVADPACVDLAALNCSWYVSDAIIRDPQVMDFCLQKLARESEARPLSGTEVSAVLTAIYVLAVLAMLAGLAAAAWCRTRWGAVPAPFEGPAGPAAAPAASRGGARHGAGLCGCLAPTAAAAAPETGRGPDPVAAAQAEVHWRRAEDGASAAYDDETTDVLDSMRTVTCTAAGAEPEA
jgi:hypothetical protein